MSKFYSDQELLEDLQRVAELVGETSLPLRVYSRYGRMCSKTIMLRFGSWNSAVTKAGLEPRPQFHFGEKKRRNTYISDNLRYTVLKRDRFRCVLCGRSPAKSLDIELHIDHVKPVAKGGLSVLENLQTLCAQCNWGKGADT